MKKTTQGNSGGFTLIELLVVVLIIGILASIAIPQYFKVVERARLSEAQTFISQVKQAQERYLARNGSYVQANAGLDQLDISFPTGGGAGFYGMKFYSVNMTAGGGSCDLKYGIELTRMTANAGSAPRYGQYKVLFDRCDSKISYPGCAGCDTDFAQ